MNIEELKKQFGFKEKVHYTTNDQVFAKELILEVGYNLHQKIFSLWKESII